MQDAGGILARVLCSLRWPFHVLCEHVQYLHEDLLHLIDCHHHLLDAIQASFLHHLRRTRWLVPPLEDIGTSCTLADLCAEHRMDRLAILMELLTLAWIRRIRAPNRNAPQNACRWEPHFALCRVLGPLQVLLHSQLVSISIKGALTPVKLGFIAITTKISSAGLNRSQHCSRQDSTLTSYTITSKHRRKANPSDTSSPCEITKWATELNQQNKWIRMNHNMKGLEGKVV